MISRPLGTRWVIASAAAVLARAALITAVIAAALALPSRALAETGALVTPPAIRFERVDARYSFPQGSVYSLDERADGYLWATTLDGLVRFDGLRQRTYDRGVDPNHSTSRLTALFIHRPSDTLWVGTEDGGVALLQGDRLVALEGVTPEPLGAVTGLRIRDDGRLLHVFRQGGVEVIALDDGDPPRGRRGAPTRRGASTYGCGAALIDGGALWQADEGGLYPIPLDPEPSAWACRVDPRGGIWLRSDQKIWWIDGGDALLDPRGPSIPDDAVPLAEGSDGDLWLRFRDPPRLGRVDRDGRLTRYDQRYGIDPLGDPVETHVDREGGLWIGTTIGLYRHLGDAIGGLDLRVDDTDTPVSIVHHAADGRTWLVGRDASLAALHPDGALVRYTSVDETGGQSVRADVQVDPEGQPWTGRRQALSAIAVLRDGAPGELWIGADVGLLRHRSDDKIEVHASRREERGRVIGVIPGGVNDLLVDPEGLWIATAGAVVRFEGGQVIHIYGAEQGVPPGVMALHRDREGTLWAATRGGVVRRRGDRFEAVAGLGEATGAARSLLEDDLGRLWVGTYDRGLFRRLPDGAVEAAGPAEGLPRGLFSLRFDARGFLWTTSNRGLWRMRSAEVDRALASGERVSAVRYDQAAGLPASECNGGFGAAAYPCQGDAWCVHTMGGVGVVRLDAVPVTLTPPTPIIESVVVDGIERPIVDGAIEVLADERDVVVHYTGVAFDAAEAVTFRHRLLGQSERWVDAETRRVAAFNDLPPGRYTLEVRAESREGVVREAPARLTIEVLPAWWELGWVRLGALLVGLGLGAALVLARMGAQARRHRRREEALRASADELEAKIRERTAVLDAEVVERRRAEEAAVKASAVKSVFVAQMSHELRTPMNAIIALTDFLAGSSLTAEQRAWVETVRASGDALLSIIEDILDFSRIEAGHLELERRTYDPIGVVAESIHIVAPSARRAGLTIRWEADPTAPRAVVGDPSRLRQVLLNLVNNAIKFTSSGTVAVRIAATTTDEGWRLKIAVRDTGIGVAPEARARIFEPFVQADASTSRRYGGSGLGLAITRRLVEAMGGAIHLESEVGVGSTFTVEIQVARPESARPESAAAVEPAAEPRASIATPPRIRVLIAEDDPINQMVASTIVKRVGCDFAVASSGEEALARLTAERFDVVLMDLHMPGMSGIEACKRLRVLPLAEQPWVIALTAAVTVEDRQACLAAGMDDFLGKPVREHELRAALMAAADALAARARDPVATADPRGS